MKTYLLVIVMFAAATPCLGNLESPRQEEVIRLPTFVVSAKGAVYLKMHFRNHLIFRGLRDLTFTALPASWGAAGIEIGDSVTAIDGKPVLGMGVLQLSRLLEAKLRPLQRKQVQEVPLTFEINSKSSARTWSFSFLVKGDDCITFGT